LFCELQRIYTGQMAMQDSALYSIPSGQLSVWRGMQMRSIASCAGGAEKKKLKIVP
jgi:hypothetical protein